MWQYAEQPVPRNETQTGQAELVLLTLLNADRSSAYVPSITASLKRPGSTLLKAR